MGLPELASTGLPVLFIGTLTPVLDMTCVTGVMCTGLGALVALSGAGATGMGTACCGMRDCGTKNRYVQIRQCFSTARDHSLSMDGSNDA